MLLATLAIFYLPPETFPPYLLGFLLGFGSGAAMIPYSIIKEVNPDHAKGSATGAMNFLVFVMTALAAPAIGWWMQKLAGGAELTQWRIMLCSRRIWLWTVNADASRVRSA